MKVDPKQALDGTLYSRGEALEVARRHSEAIQKLANVTFELKQDSAPQSTAMRSTPEFDLVLHVPAAQLGTQRARLAKDREQLEKNIANSRRQLRDDKFLSRAPQHVVSTLEGKLVDYEAQLAKVNAALETLGS
jgi:valyl-tRNA synthetase